MRRYYYLVILVCVCLQSYAQSWVDIGYMAANNSILALTTDTRGHLYAAGGYTDSMLYPTGHRYVSVWDGLHWSELGTGTHALRANAPIYAINVDAHGNVYAAGAFTDTNRRTYVAHWDGSSWHHLGIDTSGLNAMDPIYAVASDDSGRVYAAGGFRDSFFSYGYYCYVAIWDGHWHELGPDSGVALNANAPIYALTRDPQRRYIYAAGAFTDTAGYSYVARWDGGVWRPLGTGAYSLRANAPINCVTIDAAGNVYAAGQFTDSTGQYYIAKWNGSVWSKLQSPNDQAGLLGVVNALTVDSAGNVYAAGHMPDSSGNFYIVVKWNGQFLAEAHSLMANDAVLALAADAHGNVYAAGNFTDMNGLQYVAAYTTTILPSGINDNTFSHLHIYPAPAVDMIKIETDATDADMILSDMSGRILYSRHIDGDTDIDLSTYATGMYLLTVHTADGRVASHRIVKQ